MKIPTTLLTYTHIIILNVLNSSESSSLNAISQLQSPPFSFPLPFHYSIHNMYCPVPILFRIYSSVLFSIILVRTPSLAILSTHFIFKPIPISPSHSLLWDLSPLGIYKKKFYYELMLKNKKKDIIKSVYNTVIHTYCSTYIHNFFYWHFLRLPVTTRKYQFNYNIFLLLIFKKTWICKLPTHLLIYFLSLVKALEYSLLTKQKLIVVLMVLESYLAH